MQSPVSNEYQKNFKLPPDSDLQIMSPTQFQTYFQSSQASLHQDMSPYPKKNSQSYLNQDDYDLNRKNSNVHELFNQKTKNLSYP